MSQIFYKFKSAKDFDTLPVDGTGLSVFDIKREIMIGKKLGKGTDFDLVLYNAQTNDEYDNDSYIIPRNTSVLVARKPAARTGKGTAQRYLAAQVMIQKPVQSKVYSKPMITPGFRPVIQEGSEQDAITQMFKQQSEQWQQTQDQMATVKPIFRPIAGARPGFRPMMDMMDQRPPPPGYTCFRCGEKGHYINVCPTLADPDFETKPRIKKATGIPTMFLKTIKNKDAIDRGLMVTGEGDLVVAMPNDEQWKKTTNKTFKSLDDAYDTAPPPPGLSCYICKKVLKDAVVSRCCNTRFCDDCIRTCLLDNGLVCPTCGAKMKPDELDADFEARQEVDGFMRGYAKNSLGANVVGSSGIESKPISRDRERDRERDRDRYREREGGDRDRKRRERSRSRSPRRRPIPQAIVCEGLVTEVKLVNTKHWDETELLQQHERVALALPNNKIFQMKDIITSGETLEERMERLHDLHQEKERELNKEIDNDIRKHIDHPILGVQLKKPYISRPSNPSLFFLVPNEFAERFCFYGFYPLLKNLFGQGLGLAKYSYDQNGKIAGEVDNSVPIGMQFTFQIVTYITPLIGAVISDSFLDKFKTIVLLSTFYLAGIVMLFCVTNPHIANFTEVFAPIISASPLNQTVIDSGAQFIPSAADLSATVMPYWGVVIALGLIAFGTGGIKPCVSAHGGDQFLPEQTSALNQFYSVFYIAINLGSLIAGFAVPAIKESQCFGTEKDCYSYAFLVCASVFVIAYLLFIFGKRYYRIVPPAGRFIIWDLLKAWFYKLRYGQQRAQEIFGKSVLVEASDLGKVLIAILPTPIFWMGFNQNGSLKVNQGNTWQDSTDRLGTAIMTSEQLNAVINPILIVILAPLFSGYIYPKFPKFTMMWRMTVGYLFAAVAFVLCGLIEAYVLERCKIDDTLPQTDPYFQKCALQSIDNTIWIIPYIFVTCAEVLVSISGLNFMYQEVGKRTKSSASAIWLVTVSVGSVIARTMYLKLNPGIKVTEKNIVTYVGFYYICAGVLVFASICQMFIARWYVSKTDREESKHA